MPKGTSPDETASSCTKIESIPLAIVELHLSEDVSQSDSQSVKNSVNKLFKKFHSSCFKTFQANFKAYWLCFTQPILPYGYFRNSWLVFRLYYLVGHAHFFVVLLMNHGNDYELLSTLFFFFVEKVLFYSSFCTLTQFHTLPS